jgi:micrococcal nuclease
VYRVVDGDTVKVKLRSGVIRTVRLVGIDTPETVAPRKPPECGGPQASKAMTKLAMRREHGKLVGRNATLVSDPTQDARDRYGRTLGYIEIGGRDIGRQMIRAGWSPVYVFHDPFRRLGSYTAAENVAKAEHRGVWSICGGDFHKPR